MKVTNCQFLQAVGPHRRKGSTLVIALVLLAILTLATATSMRTSTMELRMAGNEEVRVATLQMTQSIIDAVVSNSDNIIVAGDVGFVNCTPNVNGCSRNTVSVDTALVPVAKSNNASVIVERLGPALMPAPRGINSSADAFFSARFQVDTTYDGTAFNEGKAGIVQGVMVLVPRSAQTN